ncbi:hypothetical protein BSKO_08650 [Bryopsis sp. KO-2023]|nr:hypothetical protein BSKO_08650 [Bryopsis sp. KO-2023]
MMLAGVLSRNGLRGAAQLLNNDLGRSRVARLCGVSSPEPIVTKETAPQPTSPPSTSTPLPNSPVKKQGGKTPLTVALYNFWKEKIGTVQLDANVFGTPVRKDILQQVVRWQLAKKQQGTHKTKKRGEVSGGGRKPWAQKGTGRARAGSIRPPHFRGGGVAHGPVPRSHEYKLNKKVKRLGLKCALSAKASEDRLLVVDSLKMEDGKTKNLHERLSALLGGTPRTSVLMIDTGKEADDGGALVRQAGGNISGVEILPVEGLNVYSVLKRDTLVLTRNAVDIATERLTRPIKR